MVAIVIAAAVVNRVIGDVAEANLIRIAEENTARDGAHIQSMMKGTDSMQGMQSDAMPSAGVVDSGNAVQQMQRSTPHGMPSTGAPKGGNTMLDMQQPVPLRLEYLASP